MWLASTLWQPYAARPLHTITFEGAKPPGTPRNFKPASGNWDAFDKTQAPHQLGSIQPQWKTVTPGLRHATIHTQYDRGPLLVNVVEVDLKNPGLEVRPVLAGNRLGNKATLEAMAKETGMLAGINATYFRMLKPFEGIPLGAMIQDGHLITGPLFKRSGLGITKDGRVKIDQLSLQGELRASHGRRVRIHNLNQLPDARNENRPATLSPWNETIAYTRAWGSHAPAIEPGLLQVQIKDNRVSMVSRHRRLAIPENGYVLVGPDQGDFAKLHTREPIKINMKLRPDWSDVQHALCAGPLLVKNGQVVFKDRAKERFNHLNEELGSYEPRSAAGVTANGKLLLVTIDGRQPDLSMGLSLHETAELMQKLGAVHAINLDGGRSTQMTIGDKLANTPCQIPCRPVPTALGVFKRQP